MSSSIARVSGMVLKRQVFGTKANRLVVAVDSALGIPRHPAGWVFEEANSPDFAFGAQIKPVPRIGRHSNQVACFHFNRCHCAIAGPDVKYAPAVNYEAHLVVVMRMFAAELEEHLIEAGCLWRDVDDIC